MFLNYSPIFRHPPSLIWVSLGWIPQISFSTMRMLRLPSSISSPSVSLVNDTTHDAALFLTPKTEATYSVWNRIFLVRHILFTAFRVETLGSPVFPCIHILTLM
jgi:hypothetical protein